MTEQSQITMQHLRRHACVYVRQATLPPGEGTAEQCALRDRAAVLGWAPELVVVIDDDLGRASGSAGDRAGFRKLLDEIAQKRVGLVLALEVSRLTRALADWRQFVEVCARTNTLIGIDEAVYDPAALHSLLAIVPERHT